MDLEIIKGQQPARQAGAAVQQGSTARMRPMAPPTGFAKIHVDAGVSPARRKGSAAAVCRDEHGTYLGSSSLVVPGIQDPAILEAIACREAYALAEDLALHNFIIACDAKQVVEDINKNANGTYGMIIQEIRKRAERFNSNILYEGRRSNNDAHSLAKYSLRLAQGRQVWLLHPHDPACILQTVVFDE